MKVERILSERNQDVHAWMDLVYEWEDIFSRELGIPLGDAVSVAYGKWTGKLYRRMPGLLRLRAPSVPAFRFELVLNLYCRAYNRKNIIPCIVDFYMRDRARDFINNYRHNPVVLVSSREACAYLEELGCTSHVNVQHLALSLPDTYRLNPQDEPQKKYDLVLNGRQNPVLREYAQRYAKSHPDFLYVYCERNENDYIYRTSAGETLGNMRTREDYMQLLRQSRTGLYSTPGMDDPTMRSQGFNQVTPRFLELLACGCHVIARYKENPDTEYYELNRFSPSVASYGQFEEAMDNARATAPDLAMYAAYLENHYTSRRAQELKSILEKLYPA